MTRALLLLVVLGGLLAGCGQSGEAAKPVQTTEVVMPKSYRFDPKVIEVEAGATVTWRNEDNFSHTVRVEGQETREVDRGESISITFPKAGRYEYVCTLHSHDMKGEIIVR